MVVNNRALTNGPRRGERRPGAGVNMGRRPRAITWGLAAGHAPGHYRAGASLSLARSLPLSQPRSLNTSPPRPAQPHFPPGSLVCGSPRLANFYSPQTLLSAHCRAGGGRHRGGLGLVPSVGRLIRAASGSGGRQSTRSGNSRAARRRGEVFVPSPRRRLPPPAAAPPSCHLPEKTCIM